MIEVDEKTVATMRAKLEDKSTSLPEKYRVMFSLRNVEGDQANKALLHGEAARTGRILSHTTASTCSMLRHASARTHTPRHAALKDSSALFRHDVAFCLGQRQDQANMEVLAKTLADTQEHAMCVCSVPALCVCAASDSSAGCTHMQAVHTPAFHPSHCSLSLVALLAQCQACSRTALWHCSNAVHVAFLSTV